MENIFHYLKDLIMEINPGLKPALMGAAGGAIALAIVGFMWGGWVTGGTAEQTARTRADAAVVTALAPICADKFRKQADSTANLVELKKASSWQQGTFIEKGGWATLPGSERPDSGVARACAVLLSM